MFVLLVFICYYKLHTTNSKFFNEHPKNSHLDARYGKIDLSIAEKQKTLKHLLSIFSKHCENNSIKSIIMHGSLIGFYFNKCMLPWDDDIDMIICDKESKQKLHTQLLINDVLLEVNPNHTNYDIRDKENVISARVISKVNGVFIDITYFEQNDTKKKFYCKDKHVYKTDDILPLKKDIFENSIVYVPNNIESCLKQEYGKDVLKPYYKNFTFENGQWIQKHWSKENLFV